MNVSNVALRRILSGLYHHHHGGVGRPSIIIRGNHSSSSSPSIPSTSNIKRAYHLYPPGVASTSYLASVSLCRQRLTCSSYLGGVRYAHSGGGNDNLQNTPPPPQITLPNLMTFPPIVWPRFINAIRNWFFITFIIKPYFDKEFSMQDFLVGAKEAVAVVANKLSEGNVEELEGLVDPSALLQIKDSLSKFTVFQQQLLRVAVEDIFFAFPYQIGIIIPDDDTSSSRGDEQEGVKGPPQTRHVEITVCLHVLRGLAEKHQKGEIGHAFDFQAFAQDERNKLNVMVCNYRFFKDFTAGAKDPSWIINMVNHFLPMELANKR